MTEQETPRQQAARLRLAGVPMSEIADQLGLTRQCIHNWTRDDLVSIDLTLPRNEAKELAERYQREHKDDESLSAWLRRLWIGDAE